MKADEFALLQALAKERLKPPTSRLQPSHVAAKLRMHLNRLNYILSKWANKGWWAGWMTMEGMDKAADYAREKVKT